MKKGETFFLSGQQKENKVKQMKKTNEKKEKHGKKLKKKNENEKNKW